MPALDTVMMSHGVCVASLLLQVSASHHGQPKLSVIAEVEERTPEDSPLLKEEAEEEALEDNDTTPLLEPSSTP